MAYRIVAERPISLRHGNGMGGGHDATGHAPPFAPSASAAGRR